MIIGYTSGVFDKFHIGHKIFLFECLSQCDILHIGVDSDSRVKKLKGHSRPIDCVIKRVYNVSKYSDHVFIKDNLSSYYLDFIKPDIVFDSDQKITDSSKENLKYKRIIIPYTHFISTTKLIELGL